MVRLTFHPRHLGNLPNSISIRQRLQAEQQPRRRPAQAGNQQKQPHLPERLAAHQQRRTQAARRVHAHTGNVNAEDVNRHQCDADGQPGKARRRALLDAGSDGDGRGGKRLSAPFTDSGYRPRSEVLARRIGSSLQKPGGQWPLKRLSVLLNPSS